MEATQSAKGSEADGPSSRTGPRELAVGAALAAVYVIWGSTYLALRFGLEGFPPFLLNAIRFLVAGGVLYTVLRLRGIPSPSRRHWWNAARVGALMLVGGVGLVTIAEDLGVGSGVAATAVAVIPLWAALVSGLFGRWPTGLEWVGLVVGFVGVILLAQEGDFRSSPVGMILVVAAPIFWAIGSVWGSHLELPRPAMATATQLLAGGAALLVLGPLRGEQIPEVPTATAWLALAYLIVFGSIVAYTAYIYLLRTVRPALATSYAYANPVVAVVLGVTLGAEILTGPALVALPLILAGVGLVALAQRRARRGRRPLPLPTCRTFLITDVEGSTRLWEEHPEAMHVALARHDKIVRRALEAHGGRVFSVVGDSFAAAFDTSSQAAAAALAAQRSLTAQPWDPVEIRVRIALNTGEANDRDGRFYGLAVNRAARLLEAAHGGQVLVSSRTHQLLATALPANIELIDLGEHPLRDLRRAERVFQLTHPELAVEFPPLRRLEVLAGRPAVA